MAGHTDFATPALDSLGEEIAVHVAAMRPFALVREQASLESICEHRALDIDSHAVRHLLGNPDSYLLTQAYIKNQEQTIGSVIHMFEMNFGCSVSVLEFAYGGKDGEIEEYSWHA
ncbi:MAG: hypothetical protein NXH85_07705 [Pseudomonadaceae bacterium]|nr:hypothetical protein [Pseudomonadaceae bacterium]